MRQGTPVSRVVQYHRVQAAVRPGGASDGSLGGGVLVTQSSQHCLASPQMKASIKELPRSD